MEVYRSGHNGPDSKSGIRQRIVGSNPTASAIKNLKRTKFVLGFLLCKKDRDSNGWVATTLKLPLCYLFGVFQTKIIKIKLLK